jgi:PRD1 phage membrane DNA delivery
MDRLTEAIVTILSLIVGVAILSVLVSPKAQTSQVIQATASGFGNDLAVAMSPVTGAATNIVLTYPNQNSGGMPSFGQGMPTFGS